MRMQRVVVGVDFSEPSLAAARWTAQHFAPGSELVLVHSIHISEPPSFLRRRFPPTEQLVETALEGADSRLRALAQSLDGTRVTLELRVGRPADQIARVAADLGADVIVVGTMGERSGVWDRLGSTAERLAWGSAVPVLLAAGMRDARPERILAAVDDDDDVTASVLHWARGLSERFDAAVVALNVVSSAVLSHVLSMALIGPDGRELDAEQVQEEFRIDTDRWLRKMVASGLRPERTDCEIAFGYPAQEIVAAAQRLGIDLIVIGSRRPGRLRRALLGTIAGEVLRRATRPVLVVKEPEPESAEADAAE